MEMHVRPKAKHQAVATGDPATRESEQKHHEVNLQAAGRSRASPHTKYCTSLSTCQARIEFRDEVASQEGGERLDHPSNGSAKRQDEAHGPGLACQTSAA